MCQNPRVQDYAAGQWLSKVIIQRWLWPQLPCFGAPNQLCIRNCVCKMCFELFWRLSHSRTVETECIELVWTASGKKKDLIFINYFDIKGEKWSGSWCTLGKLHTHVIFTGWFRKKWNTLSINCVLCSLLLPGMTFCSSVTMSLIGPGPSIQSDFSSSRIIDGLGVVCVSDNWEYTFLLDFPVLSICLDEIQGVLDMCIYSSTSNLKKKNPTNYHYLNAFLLKMLVGFQYKEEILVWCSHTGPYYKIDMLLNN